MELTEAEKKAYATVLSYCAWQSHTRKEFVASWIVCLSPLSISLVCWCLYQIWSSEIVRSVGVGAASMSFVYTVITLKYMWPLLFCDHRGVKIWCDAQGIQWSHGEVVSKPYLWSEVVSLRFGTSRLRERPLIQRALHAMTSAVLTMEMADGRRLRIAPGSYGLKPAAPDLIACIAYHGRHSTNEYVSKEDWDYLVRVVFGDDLRRVRAGCIVLSIPAFISMSAAFAYWLIGAYVSIVSSLLWIAGGLVLVSPLIIPLVDRLFNGPNRS